MAGLSEIPAVIIEADDKKTMELALIENLQRQDLNPVEEALGYRSLMDDYGLSQEETAARVMLVVGSDASGATHPDWEDNMSLAVKLHAQLERTAPGICRPISFRSQRFNQDQSPGAVLLEVGSAGNTRQEALAAARIIAQAILAMAE